MKKWLLLCWLWLGLVLSVSVHADVDYSIEAYYGDLLIHEDNSATFKQTIIYVFDSSYKGQYVTLGKAGKMPPDFAISPTPQVVVYRNEHPLNPQTSIETLSDGYSLKIYNPGNRGDRVRLEVVWQLHNLLFLHQDVAELNWQPISDWDETLDKVVWTVRTEKKAEDSQLFAHTGYFKPSPHVSQDGNSYHIDAGAISGALELRAYWDRGVISADSHSTEEAKQRILSQESDIGKHAQWLRRVYFSYLPQVTGLILVVSVILFVWRRHLYLPKQPSNRQYEAPDDLHPLLVARWVYGASLKEPKNNLTFAHLIQSSLLDLLDRGLLTIADDQQTLIVHRKVVQDELDKALLAFLCGLKVRLPISDLFQHYAVNKDIFSSKGLTGQRLEQAIRQRGQLLQREMAKGKFRVDQAVATTLERLGKSSCFRPMTAQEVRRLGQAQNLMSIGLVLHLVMGLYALMRGWLPAFLVSLALFTVLLVILLAMVHANRQLQAVGLLKREGEMTYNSWQAYVNMFKALGTFERVELAGLIVWNRVLVYATLFGQTQRVSNHLRLHQITFDNPSLNTYMGANLYRPFRQSLHNYHQYASTASKAAHFSVSSTGSSGGGFSGGGGGGGGGAF